MAEPGAGLERLQKVMAAAGVASRRQCEVLITEGRVTVNGRKVSELGTQVRAGVDQIAVDGRPVETGHHLEYWAVYKPPGVLSAAADARGRRTVVDLVKHARQRVVPVGRLDLDAEGLLLLTNDGELTNRLIHPRFGVEKEYRVLVRGVPDAAGLDAISKGAMVEGKWAAPKSVAVEGPDRPTRPGAPQTWLRLILTEGRKREIKVICAAAGYPVARLIRVRFGPLHLGKMYLGEARELTPGEVHSLKRTANLP